MEKLEFSAFKTWVLQKRKTNRDVIIGDPNDCYACPIAVWLHETTQGFPVVHADDIRIYPSASRHEEPIKLLPPDWIAQFVWTIDANTCSVTAQQAATILATMEKTHPELLMETG